jgi:hypothetical protein
LTEQQVLMMLELCLEAEERCDERISAARQKEDYSTAAYEVQLKEQYENMRARLLEEMRFEGATTQDLHDMLQQVAHSVEKFGRPAELIDSPTKPA